MYSYAGECTNLLDKDGGGNGENVTIATGRMIRNEGRVEAHEATVSALVDESMGIEETLKECLLKPTSRSD